MKTDVGYGRIQVVLKKYLIVVTVIGLIFLVPGSFLSGFIVAEMEIKPYSQIKRQLLSVREHLTNLVDEQSLGLSIETVFLWLGVSDVAVPVSRKGQGGGLTSMGQELLLLAYTGELFKVDKTRVQRTKIKTPDNGYNQFRIDTKSKKYKGFNHDLFGVKYNDIIFISHQDRAYLVISYNEWHSKKQCFTSTVASLAVKNNTSSILEIHAEESDWNIIFRSKPCLKLKNEGHSMEGHMAGGRFADIGKGRLLFTIGDYHRDGYTSPLKLARDLSSDYGKVIEIEVALSSYRIVSFGHRNPQGITVDQNGMAWVVEHGMRGGDELNLIKEGADYGWPVETLGTTYEGKPWPFAKQYGRHDSHVAPVYAWVPSVGISNLTVIKNFHESWDGDLLAASLGGRQLFRLRIKNSRVVFSEPISVGSRIRYAHQHSSGDLALWTDDERVIFLSPKIQDPYTNRIEAALNKINYSEEIAVQAKMAITSCRRCHSLGKKDHRSSPPLGGVHGSNIGSTAYSSYSKAMLYKEGKWTTKRLKQFILDPQSVVPGSTMPSPGISDPDVAAAVAQALEAL